MSQPLYTNDTSDKYREMANIMRDKMNSIRNSDKQSMFKYGGVPNVLEKCNNLAIECDNIAAKWLSDTDYYNALLRIQNALLEVNNALDNYNSSMYVVPLEEVDLSNSNNNYTSNNPEDS